MSRQSPVIAALVILLAVGVGVWLFSAKKPRTQDASSAVPRHTQSVEPATNGGPSAPSSRAQNTSSAVPPVESPTNTSLAPVPSEDNSSTRALIQNLAALDFSRPGFTAEQAAVWKTNLQSLIEAGTNSIPGIREFLRDGKDVRFNAKQGENLVGYPSLRVALLNALQQIGGPAALNLALETLGSASQPNEIAQIAQHLEADGPGQHRDAILAAARNSLAMGTAGKLEGADVGPLFDVMSRYGGVAAVGDLQGAASPYRYYSAVALANLPEGAGISALSQMLREPNGPNKSTHTPALEALAQLAAFYPEAGARLIEQAKLNQVPDTLWPSIAETMSGARFMIGNLSEWGLSPQSGDKTFHLAAGNQNVLKRRNIAQFTTEQREQVRAYVQQLLALNLSPVATEHLQKAQMAISQ